MNKIAGRSSRVAAVRIIPNQENVSAISEPSDLQHSLESIADLSLDSNLPITTTEVS